MAAGIHILHIDDDDEIRLIVALSLGLDPDFRVSGVASAREAFDLLGAPDPEPDAILIDYMLPGTDGTDLIAALCATPSLAGVPLIVLSARTTSRDTDRMRAAGATAVIPKPFNPLTLAGEVRALLRGGAIEQRGA